LRDKLWRFVLAQCDESFARRNTSLGRRGAAEVVHPHCTLRPHTCLEDLHGRVAQSEIIAARGRLCSPSSMPLASEQRQWLQEVDPADTDGR